LRKIYEDERGGDALKEYDLYIASKPKYREVPEIKKK